MKNRQGFTLAELVLAIFIFSFIAASLATIVSTANRHMFQNYRTNIIKTNVLITMKSIQNNLSVATRVDQPAADVSGNVLAFATNVDQTTGCYPVYAVAPAPARHYFCMSGTSLYYHTDSITGSGSATACGSTAPVIWTASYPTTCGSGGTLMMENVFPSLPGAAIFSRKSADGINGVDTVRVWLRSKWDPASSGLGGAQREVDTSLDTVIRFNRSKP